MADVQTPLPTALSGLRAKYAATTIEEQVLKSSKESTVVTERELGIDPVQRPSITFHPSWDQFQERSKRLAHSREGKPAPPLPVGYPDKITGRRLWSCADVNGGMDFVVDLGEGEVAEIEQALAYFKGLPGNNGPDQICKNLFPLPSLGKRLDSLSDEIHNGTGVVILRGLDASKYTALENVLIFTGVASYMGERFGCQDRNGNMLMHLTDMAFKFGEGKRYSPTFTPEPLPFHNDVCDVLCMYVLETASNGGDATLSSSTAVYNDLAQTRPDIINTLSAPIWTYDKDKVPEKWYSRPLVFLEPKHGPFFCFNRQKITGSERFPLSPELPPMTEEQAEALDAVNFAAEKHSIKLSLKRGDLVFYNNFAVLHGRTAFVNDSNPAKADEHGRHILRLWTRNEELAWTVPQGLEHEWKRIYGDSERRGKACWRISREDMERHRVIGHKFTCS